LVFFFMTWIMFIGLGALTWALGGFAWFAYAAVLLLNGIFWELEGTGRLADETERVSWAMYRELRRIRRGLPQTPRTG